MRIPTLSEAFWAIVDANWLYTEVDRLTHLWKHLEDAYIKECGRELEDPPPLARS